MRSDLVLAASIVVGCGGAAGGGGGDGRGDGGAVTDPDAGPGSGAPPDASSGGSVAGCGGATFLPVPSDPAARGPWPVGARTVTIGRLTAEVWYPAAVGSDAGRAAATYDIRDELPAAEAAKIPDKDNPLQHCECNRDLPLDGAHGPYPIVVFVHGTAAFRTQSLPIVTHWASRGFVVVAADHPGLVLGDFIGGLCNEPTHGSQDLSGDLDAELAALAASPPTGDLAFLAGHVDPTRIAIAGHSAGANAAAAATTKPGVRLAIVLAGNTAAASSPHLASSLFMGGTSDGIVSWSSVQSAWSGSPTPRRLVGIGNAGHLVFSDLCQIQNAAGQNILAVAQQDQVCGAALAGLLFDCNASYIDGPTGWDVTDYATSDVLESTLQCATGLPDLSSIMQVLPAVSVYQQAL
jgi:alpha-beta hydrolase superfamily lysophospholipase